MTVFEQMTAMGHEQVLMCRNDAVGLRAIIAIHDTTLGPALGGCRLYDYGSEEDALRDVLRLSRGMTYKAAVSGLDLGGGKAVIIGDPSIKSEALFRAFGRHVHSLGGRYVTAEDMNTNVEDMNWIARETPHVCGHGTFAGGSGDPSPVTAWGVFHGIRASLEVALGEPATLKVRMLRPLVSLKVLTFPKGAVVKINNKKVGKTPLTAKVPAFQKARISVSSPGYQSYSKQLYVKKSGTIKARLKKSRR